MLITTTVLIDKNFAPIRLFVNGDYEYLQRVYWMRLPLSVRLNGLFVTTMKSEDFKIQNQRNNKKCRPINNYIIIAILMKLYIIVNFHNFMTKTHKNIKLKLKRLSTTNMNFRSSSQALEFYC